MLELGGRPVWDVAPEVVLYRSEWVELGNRGMVVVDSQTVLEALIDRIVVLVKLAWANVPVDDMLAVIAISVAVVAIIGWVLCVTAHTKLHMAAANKATTCNWSPIMRRGPSTG